MAEWTITDSKVEADRRYNRNTESVRSRKRKDQPGYYIEHQDSDDGGSDLLFVIFFVC